MRDCLHSSPDIEALTDFPDMIIDRPARYRQDVADVRRTLAFADPGETFELATGQRRLPAGFGLMRWFEEEAGVHLMSVCLLMDE